MSVDPDDYRRIMGRLAAGVTVVTTVGDGIDHAMTADSVTSVSLDPVLMLVCVEREARFHDAIIEAGIWGVSILAGQDRATATWLATRGRPLHDQLERIAHHRGDTGVALLDGALATIECETVDAHPAGDHTIVVGAVVSISATDRPGDALVHYRGQFDTLR